MTRIDTNPGTELHRQDFGGTPIKWPKWALAMLFLVDGAGFGTWAAHVPVFKQLLHLENGMLTLVLVSLIVGALITMPLTGQLIARYGSRRVIRLVSVSYILMIALLAQASNFFASCYLCGAIRSSKGSARCIGECPGDCG